MYPGARCVVSGVPWVHYEQVLKPKLQSVQQLRATLDQEVREAVRHDRWEHWAGTAMARVRAAVIKAMNESGETEESQETPLVATVQKDRPGSPYASVSTNTNNRVTGSSKKKARKNILIRVPGAGPDDVVWTALNGLYAVPYLWGGNRIFGIDCSGLVTQVFHRVGAALPRTAQTQFDLTDRSMRSPTTNMAAGQYYWQVAAHAGDKNRIVALSPPSSFILQK